MISRKVLIKNNQYFAMNVIPMLLPMILMVQNH